MADVITVDKLYGYYERAGADQHPAGCRWIPDRQFDRHGRDQRGYQTLPKLLDALEFRCNNTPYRPVMDAVGLLHRYKDRDGRLTDYESGPPGTADPA